MVESQAKTRGFQLPNIPNQHRVNKIFEKMCGQKTLPEKSAAILTNEFTIQLSEPGQKIKD